MVLRGDLDPPRAQIHHGVICAMMPKIELVSLPAQRQPQQLMPETNAEHRFLAKNARDGSVSVRQRRRIARPVREKHSVGIVREYLLCSRRRGNHFDAKSGRNQPPQNVQLDSLSLGFGFEFDVAVGEFHGVFDVLAVILLANLLGFFLHERGERVEVAGDIFSRLLLGGDQGVVQAFDLLTLRLIDTVQGEMRR